MRFPTSASTTKPAVRARAVRATVLTFAAFAATGCGDDATKEVLPSSGPPSLTIRSPEEGACIDRARYASGKLPVQIEVANWKLRPLELCEGYAQCGYAAIFVDNVEQARSAALVTEVPLPATTGLHELRVELQEERDGGASLDANGDPLRKTITITVASAGGCTG